MNQHPALFEALIEHRVAELRHSARHIRREKRRNKLVAAARHGTGWLLIDMGLRLAMPGAGRKHPLAPGLDRRSRSA